MQFSLCAAVKNAAYTLPRDLSIVGSIIHQWIQGCILAHTLLHMWCIDFDESDVGFLQNTGIMQTLEKFFSLKP